MSDDCDILLEDMLVAAERAVARAGPLTVHEFEADRDAREIVLYNLIVIGAAASHLPESFLAKYPDTEWDGARRLRIVVVHEYFRFDYDTILDIMRTELPSLIVILTFILDGPTSCSQSQATR